jgi:hypothetical protein
VKDSSIKKIVKKAVTKIHKDIELVQDNLPQRVVFCFFDSKSMFIPKYGEMPNDGPHRTRVDQADFIKESDKRIREGRKLFSGVVVYDPRQVSHRSATWMCPYLVNTFENFKKRDKKFHCIMATGKDKYLEYKKYGAKERVK